MKSYDKLNICDCEDGGGSNTIHVPYGHKYIEQDQNYHFRPLEDDIRNKWVEPSS